MKRVGGWHTLWRGKTYLQMLRGVMVYVWPLSIVGRLFYRLRWSPPLYEVINRRSRRAFRSIPQVLGPHGVEAVRALEIDGIFRTSVEARAQDPALFRGLARDAGMMLAGQDVQWKLSSDTIRTMRNGTWCGRSDVVRNDRPFPRLSSGFLLQVRFNYTDVWHNIPVREGEPPISAELWHRDHEDERRIKVFVLLSDVDEAMGPFTYVKRSQVDGEYESLSPAIPPTGRYPKQDVLDQLINKTPLPSVSCVGPAGSVILCDASGLPVIPSLDRSARTVVPCREVRPVFLAHRYLFAYLKA